jgi:hypothetical protein
MAALSKPTNGSNANYASRVGALIDVVNAAAELPISGAPTPAITFATPGNLAVAYTTRKMTYRRFGDLVFVDFDIETLSFTHTTASGVLQLSGIPVAAVNEAGYIACGAMFWGGITKASFTNVVACVFANESVIRFAISGSGQSPAGVTAADTPTGGILQLKGSVAYRVTP